MKAYKTRAGVVLNEIQGVAFLVSDKKARMKCPYIMEVNETAAFIWTLLADYITEEELLEKMDEVYEVPDIAAIKSDIGTFLNQLQENNYLLQADIIWKAHKGIIPVKACGRFFLISKERKICLNETAEFYWENLINGISQEDLIKAVHDEFEIENDKQAEKEMISFLKQLQDRGFIRRVYAEN